jgi:hypothetical protein
LGGDLAPAVVAEGLGEAEVGDLGVEALVEQDVAGLDVAVDDGRVGELVQVGDALGGAEHDAEAAPPVEAHAGLAGEALLERAVGDVLVDEDLLVLVQAEAHEAHHVLVVHPGEELDLRPELEAPLQRPLLRPLHRHQLPARQRAPVNLPVPAVPDVVRLGEVVGHLPQLVEAEHARAAELGDGAGTGALHVPGDCTHTHTQRAASSATTIQQRFRTCCNIQY